MDLHRLDLPLLAMVASGALVAWRVHGRVRTLVGRQKFRPSRARLSVVLFAILVIAMLIGSFSHPAQTAAEVVGILIGIGLALYGLRVTRFESTTSGLYYTPSLPIGIALSLMLVARLAYRIVQAYAATGGFTEPPASLTRTPLTLLLVGTLAGYYACYALGLLRRHRSMEKSGARRLREQGGEHGP